MSVPPDNSAINTLRDAVAEVIADSCLGTDSKALTERSCDIQRITNQIDAIRVITIRQTERALSIEQPGEQSANLVAGETKVETAIVREDQRLGRWLDDFPVLADAHLAGVMSRSHIKLLRKICNPRNELQLQEDQPNFVAHAETLDFKDFEKVVRYWLNASDPDGELPLDQARKTGLSYRKNADGSVSGKFYLDPLSGNAFSTAIDLEAQKLFRSDTENNVISSHHMRAGRALTNLVIRGASRPDGTYPTPLVNIVLGKKLADEILSDLAGNATDTPTPDCDVDYRCEFIDGTPLHPYWAAIALAAGCFRRVVMDAKSKPIETSVKSRGFPPWMKHLLLLRARGRCSTIGCDAPLSWLQADHIKPHSKGGPTSLENGQILCDPENKIKRDTDPTEQD